MTCPSHQYLSSKSTRILAPVWVLVGTYTVGDDVGVTVQRSLGVTVLGLVAGEVPDDQGLVTRTGQEHVGAIAL